MGEGVAWQDTDSGRPPESHANGSVGMHEAVGIRHPAGDGGDNLDLRGLRADGQGGHEPGAGQVLVEGQRGSGEEHRRTDVVPPDAEGDGRNTEGGHGPGDVGEEESEEQRVTTAIHRAESRLPKAVRQILKEHPWNEGGPLHAEAVKLGLTPEQAAFVMLRTLPPPFTQSVAQSEKLIGVSTGACAYWSRSEKVGKAIIKASLAVAMCSAPEIFLRTVEMAREGDKFQTRMYYEHIAALAKDPAVMGSDFGRALAGVEDGEMASLTVIADKRRSNGRPKAS